MVPGWGADGANDGGGGGLRVLSHHLCSLSHISVLSLSLSHISLPSFSHIISLSLHLLISALSALSLSLSLSLPLSRTHLFLLVSRPHTYPDHGGSSFMFGRVGMDSLLTACRVHHIFHIIRHICVDVRTPAWRLFTPVPLSPGPTDVIKKWRNFGERETLSRWWIT